MSLALLLALRGEGSRIPSCVVEATAKTLLKVSNVLVLK
jgi:hypothetical protein